MNSLRGCFITFTINNPEKHSDQIFFLHDKTEGVDRGGGGTGIGGAESGVEGAESGSEGAGSGGRGGESGKIGAVN